LQRDVNIAEFYFNFASLIIKSIFSKRKTRMYSFA
jgi:hypothetical protein